MYIKYKYYVSTQLSLVVKATITIELTNAYCALLYIEADIGLVPDSLAASRLVTRQTTVERERRRPGTRGARQLTEERFNQQLQYRL